MTEAEDRPIQAAEGPPDRSTPVFLVSWEALEQGLCLLANPERASQAPVLVSALRRMQGSVPPDKLLMQILGATAWLTADGPPDGEASMT